MQEVWGGVCFEWVVVVCVWGGGGGGTSGVKLGSPKQVRAERGPVMSRQRVLCTASALEGGGWRFHAV
jgi:hypothetical protein